MEAKHARGRLRLRSKDTVRKGMKAWNIREEYVTDQKSNILGALQSRSMERSLQDPLPHTGRQRRKVEKL